MVHSKYLQPQLTGKREPKVKLDLRRKPVGIDREELIEIIQTAATLVLLLADVYLLLLLLTI